MADSSNGQLSQAHSLRIGGSYDEALLLYRQVVEADASAADAWWGLGLVLMNIGEFDEALEVFAKSAEIDERPKYLLDLGKLQTMLGMFDEAKPVFERVVALDENSREADDARNQLRYY
ncbi:MAG: tetratricopeptide repeat protein [Armatimonadota bacterium]